MDTDGIVMGKLELGPPHWEGGWPSLTEASAGVLERIIFLAAYNAAREINGDDADAWMWVRRTIAARAAARNKTRELMRVVEKEFERVSWHPNSHDFAASAIYCLATSEDPSRVHPTCAGGASYLGFAKAMVASELRAMSEIDDDDVDFYEQPGSLDSTTQTAE